MISTPPSDFSRKKRDYSFRRLILSFFKFVTFVKRLSYSKFNYHRTFNRSLSTLNTANELILISCNGPVSKDREKLVCFYNSKISTTLGSFCIRNDIIYVFEKIQTIYLTQEVLLDLAWSCFIYCCSFLLKEVNLANFFKLLKKRGKQNRFQTVFVS